MDPRLEPRIGVVNRLDAAELRDLFPALYKWLTELPIWKDGSGRQIGARTNWAEADSKGEVTEDKQGRACYAQLAPWNNNSEWVLLPVSKDYNHVYTNDTAPGYDKFRHYWYNEVFFNPTGIFRRVFESIPHAWITTTDPKLCRHQARNTSMELFEGAPETLALLLHVPSWDKAFKGGFHKTAFKKFTINFRQPWERDHSVGGLDLGTSLSGVDLFVDLRETHGMESLRAFVASSLLSMCNANPCIGHTGHGTLDSGVRYQSAEWWREFLTGDIKPIGETYSYLSYPSGKTYRFGATPASYPVKDFTDSVKQRKTAQTRVIAINKWFDDLLNPAADKAAQA